MVGPRSDARPGGPHATTSLLQAVGVVIAELSRSVAHRPSHVLGRVPKFLADDASSPVGWHLVDPRRPRPIGRWHRHPDRWVPPHRFALGGGSPLRTAAVDLLAGEPGRSPGPPAIRGTHCAGLAGLVRRPASWPCFQYSVWSWDGIRADPLRVLLAPGAGSVLPLSSGPLAATESCGPSRSSRARAAMSAALFSSRAPSAWPPADWPLWRLSRGSRDSVDQSVSAAHRPIPPRQECSTCSRSACASGLSGGVRVGRRRARRPVGWRHR